MEALSETLGRAFDGMPTYTGARPSGEYPRRLIGGEIFVALAAYELMKFGRSAARFTSTTWRSGRASAPRESEGLDRGTKKSRSEARSVRDLRSGRQRRRGRACDGVVSQIGAARRCPPLRHRGRGQGQSCPEMAFVSSILPSHLAGLCSPANNNGSAAE